MNEQLTITIDPSGEVHFVVDKPLEELVSALGARKRRASDVEPVNVVLRRAFHALRRWFGETGLVAEFTRRWPVVWQADMAKSGGPILGPFESRAEALASEREWLRVNTGL